jgi:GDP/GTP exchange factor required for growth at low temperature
VSVTAKGAKKSTQPAVVGCIPFLGLYLRDLTTTGELPTYLDPSCPSAEAMRDGQSGLLISLNQPFAFVDLTPLDSAHLYPLVNVHKARLMACTMQKVLIFQEMASTYSWEADPILFRKCLAIKALSTQELQQFSYRAEADRPRD